MKPFILLTLLFSSFTVLACNNKVDEKKVILFVDTNNSEPEIATAEKAACARGEKFVVVPKNYKSYTPLTEKAEKSGRDYENCVHKSHEDCQSALKSMAKAQKELEDFKKIQPKTSEAVEAALKEIRSQGSKLETLLISGHDGGGTFAGNKGEFSRYDLADIMKKFSDINDVNTLLLLGCYTGVQKEIMAWKGIFPDVRMIGGYDGTAPLSVRPQGHQYISDLMLKEKQLVSKANQDALKSYVAQNLHGLSQLNAAIYLDCRDGQGEEEFYYASEERQKGFSKLDLNQCINNPVLNEIQEELDKYESGALEPPLNSASGELRQIYNKARSLEHCIDLAELPISMNNLFNLLFYDGVKKNFAAFYKDDLARAEKIISSLTIEDIEKTSNELTHQWETDIAREKQEIELLEKNPEAYFAQQQKKLDTADAEEEFQLSYEKTHPEEALKLKKASLEETMGYLNNQRAAIRDLKSHPEKLKGIWVPTAANLAKKSRKETLENLTRIDALLSSSAIPSPAREALFWTSRVTADHLQYFQNPFSWHESVPGKVEAPSVVHHLDR